MAPHILQCPGDTEVCQEGVPSLQQDVPRLYIPVYHTLPMGKAQRFGDLTSDPDRIADGQLLLPVQALLKGLSPDEGHDIVE